MLQTHSLSSTTPPAAAGLIEAKDHKTAGSSPFSILLDLDAVPQSSTGAGDTASAETNVIALDIAAQLADPGNAGGKILPVDLQAPKMTSDVPGTSILESVGTATGLPKTGTASHEKSPIAIEHTSRHTPGGAQDIAPKLSGTDQTARVRGDGAPTASIVQDTLPAQQKQGLAQTLAATTAMRTLSAVETAKSGMAVVGNGIGVRRADAANAVPLEAAGALVQGAQKGLIVTVVAEAATATTPATRNGLPSPTPTPPAPLAQPSVQTPGAADPATTSPDPTEPSLAEPEGDAGTDAPRAKIENASITTREAIRSDTSRPVATDMRPEGFVAEVRLQSSTPTNAIASIAARAQGEAPLEFGTLVERLTEAREAAAPHAVRTAVRHAEFGIVNLQFRVDDTRLNVAMKSADPDFAPAVQGASSAAQSSNANDTGPQGGLRQDAQAQGRQSDATSQSNDASQSGSQNGGREDERNRPSQNRSVASGTGESGTETDGDSAPGGGIYA